VEGGQNSLLEHRQLQLGSQGDYVGTSYLSFGLVPFFRRHLRLLLDGCWWLVEDRWSGVLVDWEWAEDPNLKESLLDFAECADPFLLPGHPILSTKIVVPIDPELHSVVAIAFD